MGKVMVLIAFSLLLAGCFWTAEGQSTKGGSQGVEVLLQGTDSSIQLPRNMVIKSQKEFDALWQEHRKDSPFGSAKPTVNFDKKWVIASFAGWVSTGGHSLEVRSVKPGATTTLVTIVHKRPGRDCVTTQDIEFPFVIAAVDHFTPEKAEFKTVTEEAPCR